MKITVVNDSALPVSVPGISGSAIPANTTQVLIGLTKYQVALAQQMASRNVMVSPEPDPGDLGMAVVAMNAAANPGASAVTSVGQGFTLKDESGNALNLALALGLGVFDDPACLKPSVTATLSTPTAGTITSGNLSNRIEATTDAGTGALTLTLTNTGPGLVYLKAFAVAASGRILSAGAIKTVTFS